MADFDGTPRIHLEQFDGRSSGGRLPFDPSEVGVGAIVRDCLAQHAVLIQTVQIRFGATLAIQFRERFREPFECNQ